MPHDVRLHVASRPGGATARQVIWRSLVELKSYSIESDMLEVEDTFEAELPYRKDFWDLLATDSQVKITIDRSVVMVGRIGRRTLDTSRGADLIQIRGRDAGGRLVDESAPLGSFVGIGIKDLVERMVTPWYPRVELSNATNRRLLVGAVSRRARVSSEPPIFADSKHEKKVNPGESRWDVIAEFLRKGRYLGWGAADGSAFIVGKPNYAQEPQWRIVVPARNTEPSNVLAKVARYVEDVDSHYAKVVAVGESKGDGARYHSNVTRRFGQALDGPNADGTGRWFQAPKKLIVQDADLKSAKEAADWAKRQGALRRSTVRQLELELRGHGQGGGLFAFDTMAQVAHERLGWVEPWLITRVRYGGAKDGQRSSIALVPSGTELEIA